MADLTNALERILYWMQQHSLIEASLFQPGLSLSEIEKRVECLPIRLPQEVYELYQWKNGFPSHRASQALVDLDFFDLDYRVKEYWNSLNCGRNICEFTIFSDKEEELEYFVIGDSRKKQVSPVLCYDLRDWDSLQPKLKYSSLTAMMLTIAECCEKNIYHFRVEEYGIKRLQVDRDEAESLRLQFNPEAD